MVLRRILVFPTSSYRPFALTRSYVLPTSPDSFSPFAAWSGGSTNSIDFFFAVSAQTMRAVRLATATSIFGLRANILASQGSDVSPRQIA